VPTNNKPLLRVPKMPLHKQQVVKKWCRSSVQTADKKMKVQISVQTVGKN